MVWKGGMLRCGEDYLLFWGRKQLGPSSRAKLQRDGSLGLHLEKGLLARSI